MRYRGRFAPSPSGPLHQGSLFAALVSWLDARRAGGEWLLRFEDVDTERCQPEFQNLIRQQLRDFGLEWDAELPAQSTRSDRYRSLVRQWWEQGRIYACACTRRDLALFRRAGETCYPGICRDKQLPMEGHALRFRLPEDAQLSWTDRWQGPQQVNVAAQCGDPVLRRRTGDYSYQFAVTIDDAEQGITHVVRGCDLLPSTGRQMLLLQALGAPVPQYAHHPILLGSDGNKLSKSTGATGIRAHDAPTKLHSLWQAFGYACPAELATAPVGEQLQWALEQPETPFPAASGTLAPFVQCSS
nr:tRNA glutamyl-Q(34) synthetase GluQRS [Oceanococcus sp. HetDA_MAG_MS8]